MMFVHVAMMATINLVNVSYHVLAYFNLSAIRPSFEIKRPEAFVYQILYLRS